MKIGIDCDGVLTDFEWFLDFYASKYFKSDLSIDTSKYKFTERFKCTSNDEVKFYRKYLLWYIRKMPVREDAACVIDRLRSDGHKIYIITARVLAHKNNVIGKFMKYMLKKWLSINKINYDELYFVNTATSARDKTELAVKIGIDYFIEDDPQNIEELCKCCNVICISSGYNYELEYGLKALDFGEVYSYITNYENIKFLSFKERKHLSNAQQKEYFKTINSYYCSHPINISYFNMLKKHINNVVYFVSPIFKRIFNINIIGMDAINGVSNAIYVCNHRSSIDIPICYYVLNLKSPRLLIKHEYKGTVTGKLLSYMGSVFVNRESKTSGRQAQNLLIRTILNGGNVLIFPEGTRNRTDKILLPFRYGAVYISQITNKPVIPLVIKKIGKRKYNVIVGEQLIVNTSDDLDWKNNELRRRMKEMLEIT